MKQIIEHKLTEVNEGYSQGNISYAVISDIVNGYQILTCYGKIRNDDNCFAKMLVPNGVVLVVAM